MSTSRILAIDHVELESPAELKDRLLWFYGALAQLESLPSNPEARGTDTLRFRSARIELRISFHPNARLVRSRPRVTILVPSLRQAMENLEESSIRFELLSGTVRTDRRILLLDPAGNRIAFKQEWPFSPI